MSLPNGSFLEETWRDVLNKLEVCVNLIRKKKGYENCVITVCFSVGDSLDTFTVPRNEWIHGIAGAISQFSAGGMERVAFAGGPSQSSHMNSPGGMLCRNLVVSPCSKSSADVPISLPVKYNYLHVVEHFSMAELKRFLSSVRDRLGLRAFVWPDEARRKFQMKSTDPVPGAPGRSNSRKSSLILMITICVEVDAVWREAILAEVQNLAHPLTEQKRCLDDKSKSEERVIVDRQPPPKVIEIEEGYTDPRITTNAVHERMKVIRKSLPTRDDLLRSVSNLPSDGLRASTNRRSWLDLTQLLCRVQHPKLSCLWFKQLIPADGNCLFSSIMVAAGTRQLALSRIRTVVGLRKLVSERLKDLSTAGRLGSSFRREWLLSCLHDVEDRTANNLRVMCESLKDLASSSSEIDDMELLLTPLRRYVTNWAARIAGCHWGGLLTVEMAILASLTGTAIEVFGTAAPNRETAPHAIELCNLRNNCRLTTFDRRALFLPVKAHLLSPDDDFRLFSISESSNNLWVGRYPVIRVVLDGQHYEACTSPVSYPIKPGTCSEESHVLERWFDISDSLTEPYSLLTSNEEERVVNVERMFDDMPHTFETGNENGDSIDSFVDYTIYEKGPYCISLSQLRRLYVPKCGVPSREHIMLCDDIVNCYMAMLQTRSDSISMFCNARSLKPPPKTRYLESSIFESAYRGLKGPAAKKRRIDLAAYEQLILPVLNQGHWVLCLVLINDSTICVYDPLGTRREDLYNVLKSWAVRKLPLSGEKGWRFHHIRESRNCIQQGSVDCGVYVCKAAESLGLGIPFRMSQLDVSYVRRRMLSEFVHQEATSIQWPRD